MSGTFVEDISTISTCRSVHERLQRSPLGREHQGNMAGHILLAGGAEFGGLMVKADLRAMMLAGGREVPISILPTAAVPGATHQSTRNHAVYWLRGLGGRNVTSLPLLDRTPANDRPPAPPLRSPCYS